MNPARNDTDRIPGSAPPFSATSCYSFMARNFYKTVRKTYTVLLLVPKLYERNCLLDSLKAAKRVKSTQILVGVDYSGKMLEKLLVDKDMRQTHAIYRQTCILPWSISNRYAWLAKFMIPHISTSVIGVSVQGLTLQPLCNTTPTGLPATILNTMWIEMKDQLMSDVEAIMANPDKMFCEACSENCPRRQNPWHIDLSRFQPVPYASRNEPLTSGFVASFCLFESLVNVDPLVSTLQSLRNQNEHETKDNMWNLIKTKFEANASEKAKEDHYSYLVMVVDGPNMQNYIGLNLSQLIEKNDVYKLLYAGYCSKRTFRNSHFNPGAKMESILTSTTKMYYVRVEKQPTVFQGRKDEAMVIEILKGVLAKCDEDRLPRPFLLYNTRSESTYLLMTSDEEKLQIENFVESGIPVFRSQADGPARPMDGCFKGNYLVKDPVVMKDGPYKNRPFAAVADKYTELAFMTHV